MSANLPKKLKSDSIVEALLEIRFETNVLDEIVVGRLCENPSWAGFKSERLAASNVPSHIRETNPEFKYQPIIELISEQVGIRVRIASNVISIHKLTPYGSWDEFFSIISDGIAYLFEAFETVQIQRVGLRYVNLLRHSLHNVSSLNDLHMSLHIGSEVISDDLNFSFSRRVDEDTKIYTRIATPSFLQNGDLPSDTICIIDVDVQINECSAINSKDSLTQWSEMAHMEEKQSFFSFFPKKWLNNETEDIE